MKLEHLFLPTEARSITVDERDSGNVLSGYAAVAYNPNDPGTEYRFKIPTPHGKVIEVRERVDPASLPPILASRDDIKAVFNHDKNQLLGTRAAGTLRLSLDDVGLRYEIDLPDTQVGRDVATLVKRGDIRGSSFRFVEAKSEFSENRSGGYVDRVLKQFRVRDVGPVIEPAYKSSTAGMRSADDLPGEILSALEEFENRSSDRDHESEAVSTRLRMLDLDCRE